MTVTTRPSRLVFAAAIAIPALIAFALSVLVATTTTAVSVFDEGVHFDYVVKFVGGDWFPKVESLLSPETLRELSCRGTVWLPEPRCDTPLENADAPIGGVNYILMYGPVYYAIVSAIAAPTSAITGVSLFLAARVATGVIFAAGIALLAWALLRLRVPPVLSAAIAAIIAATPGLLFQGSTITPDSMAVAAGAGVLLVSTLRVSWRRRLALATALGIVIALTKPNFIPLATFAPVFAAIMPVDSDTQPFRAQWFEQGWRRVGAAVALAAVPLITALLWNTIRTGGQRADGGLNDMLRTDLPFQDILAEAIRVLSSPFTNASHLNEPIMGAATMLLQFTMIGGTILVAVAGGLDARGRERTLSTLAIGALVLSFVFLPTTFYALYHSTGTQARYAMPLVPLFAASVAVTLDRRRVVQALVAIAAAVWVIAVAVATVHHAS